MIADRLNDLNVNRSPADKVEVVIDGGDEFGEDQGSFNPEFFEEVGQIKLLMSLIRRNVKSISDAYTRAMSSVENNSQKTEELDELMKSTNAAANQVRTKLKVMKQENDALPAENPQKRMRTNMHSLLTQKFIALVQEYQTVQTNYREKFRERFQRQAEIVKPGVTREEVDQMIETGTLSFADKMLSDQKHSEAKNALLSMQEQQRDLQHLEKSIQELNQVFIDLSTIVQQSGEHITRVEADVNKSVAFSGAAAKNTSVANEHAMARRKRIGIAITTIVVIALVIAAIIGGLFAAKVFA
jgi:t-SNARE complex subunit (syntaxin)